MIFDNILSVSLTLFEIDIGFSLTRLCFAIFVECNYGSGFYWEWRVGKRFAMEPPKEMP